MAEKTITVILLQADQQLWSGEAVRFQVTDVNHAPLKVLVDKRLKRGSSTVRVELDLHFDAGQVYGISVDVKKHRSAWQLINGRTFVRQQGGSEVEVKDIVLQLMLVPNKPSSSDLMAGYERLRERRSPMVADQSGVAEQSYLDLKPAAKMALLNIEAKFRETTLKNLPLLRFVEGVRHVAVDRLFLFVRSDLKQIIEDSSEFASALGHGPPGDVPVSLPAHPDSWKQRRFGAGNLQLSFAKASEAGLGDHGGLVFSVDADIDLERGVGHVFEWLDNHALRPGNKTDQSLVYALLFSQGILPDYTLDPLSDG